MPLLVVAAVLLLLVMILVPFWYSRKVLERYSDTADYLPGTGGELARHLIERFKLSSTLERTESGDHYDPLSRTVRLSARVMDKRSLTAVAVAAHEVGHAIQHETGSLMLALRTRLVKMLRPLELLAGFLFVLVPLVAPWYSRLSILLAIVAFGLLFFRVLVHLVTLPVEFDASFGKALPILQKGTYLRPEDEGKVRKILRACALTYVSAALMELLNIFRWLRFFRR